MEVWGFVSADETQFNLRTLSAGVWTKNSCDLIKNYKITLQEDRFYIKILSSYGNIKLKCKTAKSNRITSHFYRNKKTSRGEKKSRKVQKHLIFLTYSFVKTTITFFPNRKKEKTTICWLFNYKNDSFDFTYLNCIFKYVNLNHLKFKNDQDSFNKE